MTRVGLFAVLCLSLCLTFVASEEGANAGDGLPGGIIRLGCGGRIAISLPEPHIFGGLMIRGHGPFAFGEGVPVITRVTFISRPRDSGFNSEEKEVGPTTPFPLLRPLSDAEGVSRSLDSLFAVAHPLSLFRENLADLDRWHEARVRALEEIHSRFFQDFANDALESKDAAAGSSQGREGELSEAGSDASVALGSATKTTPEATAQEAPFDAEELLELPHMRVAGLEGREALQVPVVQPAGTSDDDELDLEDFEWTPTNICGLVLLGLAFGLLVSMLLLSLSSLIYGCADEPESVVETEENVATPLLKYLQAAAPQDEVKEAVVNPLCKYEPPAAKE